MFPLYNYCQVSNLYLNKNRAAMLFITMCQFPGSDLPQRSPKEVNLRVQDWSYSYLSTKNTKERTLARLGSKENEVPSLEKLKRQIFRTMRSRTLDPHL